jgi:iron(III) transport system substrate-binding protein
MFGTTATQVAALFASEGPQKAKDYFQQLKQNGVVIADGNGAVKDMVVSGEVPIGFTDTDDAAIAIQQGKPVGILFPDQGAEQRGTLVIPNTLSLIKGCPHLEAGKKLIGFLLSREVEEMLARSGSAQMPVRPGVPVPPGVRSLDSIKAMPVDWDKVADNVEEASRFVSALFVR